MEVAKRRLGKNGTPFAIRSIDMRTASRPSRHRLNNTVEGMNVNHRDEIGKTRYRVSHATRDTLVIEMRRRIDERRDELDWLTIPLPQAASLLRDMRDTVELSPANDTIADAPMKVLQEPAFA